MCSYSNYFLSFNRTLAAQFPLHPSIFRFMATLKSEVIAKGQAIVEQAVDGVQPKKMVDKEKKRLLQLSQAAEAKYLDGQMSPTELLQTTACHYDNERLVRMLNALIPEESIIERDPDDSGCHEAGFLLDVKSTEEDIDVDDRQAVLDQDAELSDLDDDSWLTTRWDNTDTGK